MVFRPKRISTSAETDIDFGRNETAFRPKWQRQVCFYPPLNAILLGHRVVQGEKNFRRNPEISAEALILRIIRKLDYLIFS